MAAKVKLTKAQVQRIVKLREKGEDPKAIAEALKVALHVIRKVLIAQGSKRASAQSVERAKALVRYWTGEGEYPSQSRKAKAKKAASKKR